MHILKFAEDFLALETANILKNTEHICTKISTKLNKITVTLNSVHFSGQDQQIFL